MPLGFPHSLTTVGAGMGPLPRGNKVTNGAGAVVFDLRDLNVPSVLRVEAFAAPARFLCWPSAVETALATVTAGLILDGDRSEFALAAGLEQFCPGAPIEVRASGGTVKFRGVVGGWQTGQTERAYSSASQGGGKLRALRSVGATYTWAEGDVVFWMRPVHDGSGNVYLGEYLENGPAYRINFSVPRWGTALAFARTASTDSRLVIHEV